MRILSSELVLDPFSTIDVCVAWGRSLNFLSFLLLSVKHMNFYFLGCSDVN